MGLANVFLTPLRENSHTQINHYLFDHNSVILYQIISKLKKMLSHKVIFSKIISRGPHEDGEGKSKFMAREARIL